MTEKIAIAPTPTVTGSIKGALFRYLPDPSQPKTWIIPGIVVGAVVVTVIMVRRNTEQYNAGRDGTGRDGTGPHGRGMGPGGGRGCEQR